MTVQYEVTEADYVNFNLYHEKATKIKRKAEALVFTLISAAVLCLLVMVDRLFGITVSIPLLLIRFGIAMLSTGLLLVFPIYFIHKRDVKKYLRSGRHNDFIGKQTFLFHESTFEVKNIYGMTHTYYLAVEKICLANHCLYVYIGSVKAFIVPLSAFTDDKQKQSFLSLMKQKTGLNPDPVEV